MMRKVLQKDFFQRNVLDVAPDLLGMYLVHRCNGVETDRMITDVEAYDGVEDKACHAHKGRTKRTEVMFGPAGVWYVYLVYGMYDMLNIVTGDKDYPAAVLIRGTEDTTGPGKLTKELGITRRYNAREAKKKNGLWIEDRGLQVGHNDIKRTKRVGIDYAGEWADVPYRFMYTP